MRKQALTIAAAPVITALAVTGCSLAAPPAPAAVTYAPAAYGIAGECYYVNSPAEAVALQAAGLCPSSWAPTPMPVAWEDAYYSYYSSPAYYDAYVPVKARTVYVQHAATFGKANKTAIATQSKLATYRTSTGKTVKGSHLATGKVRFGSGTSFGPAGQKYGGGNLRAPSSAKAVPAKPVPARHVQARRVSAGHAGSRRSH